MESDVRILWLSHLVPYPPKGGVLQRCYYLIKELSVYHDVDLYCFVQEDLLRSFHSDLNKGLEEAKQELEKFCKSVTFFEIPCLKSHQGQVKQAFKSIFTKTGYTMDWLVSKGFAANLSEKLQSTRYDLVHFDTISLAIYRDLVSANIPVSLDHHNIESHMMLRRAKKESNFLKKVYFYLEGLKLEMQERKWCPKFNINITCSKMDTERLFDVVGDVKCVDISNGVDINYFQPTQQQLRKNSLIFIGTMNWYPNIEAAEFLLSEIFPSLEEQNIDCSLDIIGASPPKSILKYKDMYNRVQIHGFVDDIRDLIDSAYLYVCPITDGGGTKLKILDAMAMGKAIVAHPIACEGIDLEDKISVYYCNSKEDYVQAIKYLFENPQLVEKLGRNARALAVKCYSFKMIGKHLAEIMRDA